MSKNTKNEKEQLRAQKRAERMKRHIVTCPHCGKDVLDHMTQCPHCKGELTPAGYRPADEKTMKRMRKICFAVGIAVAVVVIVVYLIVKN